MALWVDRFTVVYRESMKYIFIRTLRLSIWLLFAAVAQAQDKPVEIHDRIAPNEVKNSRVALTLDACSGKFDLSHEAIFDKINH